LPSNVLLFLTDLTDGRSTYQPRKWRAEQKRKGGRGGREMQARTTLLGRRPHVAGGRDAGNAATATVADFGDPTTAWGVSPTGTVSARGPPRRETAGDGNVRRPDR